MAKVAARAEEVEDELDPERYEIKTRGVRQVPAARPAGEGIYAIASHERHTHLAYVLELPPQPGEVQRALNIAQEDSYVIGSSQKGLGRTIIRLLMSEQKHWVFGYGRIFPTMC